MKLIAKRTFRIFAVLLTVCVAGVMLAAPAPGYAQSTPQRSYREDLATLYNEHQRVLAMREACVIAQPAARTEMESAYKDWRTRHSPLVDELELRFAALIKRASKDQAEYTRNYGKYNAEVLEMREETKRAMLAGDKEKFSAECREFPAYLRDSRSNIPVLFPAEYRNVRRAR